MILSSIIGGKAIGEVAKGIVEPVTTMVDKLFTSDDERLSRQEAMERLQTRLPELQTSVAVLNAQHRSIWVAGARPALLWIGSGVLAYHWIVRDLLAWGLRIYDPALQPPPPVNGVGEVITLMLGVLGLAGLRTIEKRSGVA